MELELARSHRNRNYNKTKSYKVVHKHIGTLKYLEPSNSYQCERDYSIQSRGNAELCKSAVIKLINLSRTYICTKYVGIVLCVSRMHVKNSPYILYKLYVLAHKSTCTYVYVFA